MAHVFISYVHQNRDVIDRLAKELRGSGVTVWLDRNDIEPGARWRAAIKRAIQSGNFFIACFSREYKERTRTHMSEEITIAIDELRTRPSERAWFIPVLLNEAIIPSRAISNVEDLSDIQSIKLYEDWGDAIQRILRVLMYDDPVLARIWYLMDICERPFDDERLHAIQQLSELGVTAKPAVFVLVKATKETNLKIKKASLDALGKIGPAAADAVPTLIAALTDPEGDIRESAADALAKVGLAAVPALAATLTIPGADPARWQLEPDLVAADFRLHYFSGYALGKIGPAAAAAVPALIAALDYPHVLVRCAVATALGEIGPAATAAVPALTAALDDPEKLLGALAKHALASIKGRQ